MNKLSYLPSPLSLSSQLSSHHSHVLLPYSPSYHPNARFVPSNWPYYCAWPKSRLSPWPTLLCPLYSSVNVTLVTSTHLWTIYTYSFHILPSFIFSLVSFTLQYHTSPTWLLAISDNITACPTHLRPPFQQLPYIQHIYLSVTPKTVQCNLAIQDLIPDTLTCI